MIISTNPKSPLLIKINTHIRASSYTLQPQKELTSYPHLIKLSLFDVSEFQDMDSNLLQFFNLRTIEIIVT